MSLVSIYCCPLGSLLVHAVLSHHVEVKFPLQQQKKDFLGKLWTLTEPLKSVLQQPDGRRFPVLGEGVTTTLVA